MIQGHDRSSCAPLEVNDDTLAVDCHKESVRAGISSARPTPTMVGLVLQGEPTGRNSLTVPSVGNGYWCARGCGRTWRHWGGACEGFGGNRGGTACGIWKQLVGDSPGHARRAWSRPLGGVDGEGDSRAFGCPSKGMRGRKRSACAGRVSGSGG